MALTKRGKCWPQLEVSHNVSPSDSEGGSRITSNARSRRRRLKPSLEYPDGPQGITRIPNAGVMCLKTTCEVVGIDEPTDMRPLMKHFADKHLAMCSCDPLAYRDGKALLRPFRCVRGKATPRKFAQEHLSSSPALLLVSGDPERELHDAAVQQRTTHFEAVSHAHAIHFHQWIVREVHLEIRVFRSLNRVRRRASPIWRSDLLEHWACRWISKRLESHQQPGVSGFEEREVRVVRRGRIATEIFEDRAQSERPWKA